ncbi:Zinc finger RING/FYVE/PHD-type protein [Dioscorea alata]|uniref:Zinc finger RING/FYVE/PHD-type protein n=1 Tax=Dioscorea alata TaxID=55571 RepID=A0ACB7U8D6_DIOAL|nr:Zinc finger RING/FYVE/PHD-type protein [Dioscorea alata]
MEYYVYVVLILPLLPVFFCVLITICARRHRWQVEENSGLPEISPDLHNLGDCNKQVANIPLIIYNKPSCFSSSNISAAAATATTNVGVAIVDATANVENNNSESERCVFCLEEFKEGETLRSLPVCKHMFHQQCIDQWFIKMSSFCPLCRIRVIFRPTEPCSFSWVNIN